MAFESMPVASTAIAYMAYDDDAGELQFSFHRGGQYIIKIPKIEAERWAASASPGGYFNIYIKGKY